MSTYSTILDTKEGQAHITTKSRWLSVFPIPHTGVMAYPCWGADLKRLGTFIKWTSNDPGVLSKLHESIVRVVREVGVSGLAEIRNSAKMTEGVWKAFSGTGCGLKETVGMAQQEGIAFAVPDEVLKYIKGFQ